MRNLVSLEWWLGVVLVGLVLNIVSAYLKPIVDRALSKISRSWRDRSVAQRGKRAKVIAQLRANPHLQLLMLSAELRHRFRGVVYLLLAAIFFLGYTAIGTADLVLALGGILRANAWHRHVFSGVAALLFFFFLYERGAAEQCKALVSEAQDESIEC
jgi:hypothetical protein